MKKETIKIQHQWSYLQWIMLTCMMILMLALPTFAFEKNGPIYLQVLWYVFFTMFTFVCIAFFFINYQSAELTGKGMTFKCKLYKIKEIAWLEVKRVQIEKLATGTAGMSIIYKEWIVIYTDDKQHRNYGGNNRRKKGPWYIIATLENAKILKSYIEKYCNKDVFVDIDIDAISSWQKKKTRNKNDKFIS
ncbi:MAG: hypothetical protein LBT20_05525 [Clostridiales bacterium]|nr:hypothetical protein [Clostridiales bacterium]